jgi:polyisoprenoid-binding protein YceI
MKKNITPLTAVFFILISVNTNAQVKLNADTEKTTLNWIGEKVIGEHNGTIKLKNGWITFTDNKITSGEFIINMTTIKDDDSNARLESHLKSDDFFGVDKFPESKLVIKNSDSFEKGTATVRGDLTIKGITHPIEFKAAMQKKEDGTWFYSSIIVDRTKYNVRYGSGSFFDNLGDRTIYDEFMLKVNLLVR